MIGQKGYTRDVYKRRDDSSMDDSSGDLETLGMYRVHKGYLNPFLR